MAGGLARQGRRGPVDRFRGRLIWPISGPVRRRDRLRRAQAGRRRRRPEIPEYPGDPALQEELRPVRGGPGQTGDRAAAPGGHRRGLHRRDGLPPGRRPDRGRDLRHLVRRGAHQGAAAAADGHRLVPRARSSSPSTATPPGSRRRCARSAWRSGSSRRPSSPCSRTASTPATCGSSTVTRPCGTWWPGACRCSSSRSATRSRARPGHRRGAARRAGRGGADRRPDQGRGLRHGTRSTWTAGSA